MRRRFFFHFNKPLSKQRKKVMWSVHFKDECHFVEQIECRVPCESKARKTQPYAVMIGSAKDVLVKDGIATIV